MTRRDGLIPQPCKTKTPSRTAHYPPAGEKLFHLPTPDHRTELMIIHGEALPEDTRVPLRKEGVDLMKESPTFAEKLLQDLKSQLTIHAK